MYEPVNGEDHYVALTPTKAIDYVNIKRQTNYIVTFVWVVWEMIKCIPRY
jgi:hypothetical protein